MEYKSKEYKINYQYNCHVKKIDYERVNNIVNLF